MIIIESLPVGDYRTGTNLYEMLAPLFAADSRISIDFFSIQTSEDFRSVLGEVLTGARERGELPLIHIECHGNDDELSFADNSRMNWGELYPILRDINVATGMRLLISIAACFGAYLGKRLDLTDRAAFVALLSPSTSIYPDNLFQAYLSFYREMLTSLDGDQALTAMGRANPGPPSLTFVDAAYFFKLTYRRYLERLCTPAALLTRARDIQEKQRQARMRIATLDEIVNQLTTSEPSYFEQFRTIYFLIDLFPDNEARFPVSRTEVLQ